MTTLQRVTTPARAVANSLVEAGLITEDKVAAVVSVIAPLLPKASSSYSFAGDAEFLHSCIVHHVETHVREVLIPLVSSHHQSTGFNGRLIKDTEINEVAIELTTRVIVELGTQYVAHLFKYMGDNDGVSNYVFSRVHAALMDSARKFNDDFLTAMNQRTRAQRNTAVLNAAEKN